MTSELSVEAGRLTGRTVFVAGGTGNVGRHIVDAAIRAGATVIVPSRSQEKLSGLRVAHETSEADRLVTMIGDVSDEEDAARLRDEVLARSGRIDAVVASLGAFVPAPSLIATRRAALERVLADYLLAHFVVARTLLPALEARAGSYTLINGMLAFAPAPGSGLVSIATAGQAMLAQVLMKETADTKIRVNELVLHLGIGWGSQEETTRNGALVGRRVVELMVGTSRSAVIHLESARA